MLKEISRAQLVGIWCAAVLVIGACSVLAGVGITLSNGALLLVAGLVPPAVMLLVWRGAPPLTVAEVLYSVNEPSKPDGPG